MGSGMLGRDFDRWIAATDAYAAQLRECMSGVEARPNRLNRWARIVNFRESTFGLLARHPAGQRKERQRS